MKRDDNRMPATKAKIDAYISLESMLETTTIGSVKQRRLEYELGRLEAIDGVTTDDVIKRKRELRGK